MYVQLDFTLLMLLLVVLNVKLENTNRWQMLMIVLLVALLMACSSCPTKIIRLAFVRTKITCPFTMQIRQLKNVDVTLVIKQMVQRVCRATLKRLRHLMI